MLKAHEWFVKLDMAKWTSGLGLGQVKRIAGQKRVISSELKRGFWSIGLRVGLGRVDPYFLHELFL